MPIHPQQVQADVQAALPVVLYDPGDPMMLRGSATGKMLYGDLG